MTAKNAPIPGGKESLYRAVVAAACLDDPVRALPLGAARIVSALRAHPATAGRVDARLLSVPASSDPEGLARAVLEARPAAAGFSLYVWNRKLLLAAARRVRELEPGLLLFAGGPEATADPNGAIAEGGLDFAVAGEGEEAAALALGRVLAGGSPEGVPGVSVAAPAAGDGPPPTPRAVPDLARLPSPYLDGVLDLSGGGALWELARGCPFACHFCYESKGARGVRRFPEGVAREELRRFVAAGVRQVFVLDPTFNADPARARRVLGMLRREAPGIHFTFEARAEFLDAPLARAFAGLACSVQVGLQSARPEVLAGVGRPGFDRGKFRRAMALLSSAGAVFGLDLIFGLPGDSLSGFRESLDFALSLEPNHLDVFRLAVLPGTVLADRAAYLGLRSEEGPPYGVISAPGFPPGDLAAAEAIARACSLFYSEGRAVGWFGAVLRPLRRPASAFFRDMAGRAQAFLARRSSEPGMPPGTPSHAEIEAFQLEVLSDAYRSAGAERLYPAARDLVRLHGAWTRALAEGRTSELELSFRPEDLFGPASRNLSALARTARRVRGTWIVRPGVDGPRVELLDKNTRSQVETL